MAHQFFTPSYALESFLPRLTHALGYRGAFMAQPRNLSYTFWAPADPQPRASAFMDLPPVSYDMDKLNRVMELGPMWASVGRSASGLGRDRVGSAHELAVLAAAPGRARGRVPRSGRRHPGRAPSRD